MESADLWRKVGEYLLLRRTRLGLKNPIDVQRAGGPTYATIQKHERGEIVSTASLEAHAAALAVSTADVLREVLSGEPISAEQSRLLDRYTQMDHRGRAALLTMAETLAEARPAPHPQPDDPRN